MRRELAGWLLAVMLLGCAPDGLVNASWFQQPLGREHVLLGRVYHAGERAFVSPERLLADVRASEALLLGETHDNVDHHRLQAVLLDAFLAAHGPASVAFEMLDQTQAAALVPVPKDADELARRVAWSETGWPDFALYRPVFDVALSRGARIVAAHPAREQVRASMRGVPAERATELRMDAPLSANATAKLSAEIRESHCGHANDGMVQAMLRAQSFKDASMAEAMARAGVPVALIAGRGHIDEEGGVPVYLARQGLAQQPHGGRGRVITVALLDVDDARTEPGDYDLDGFDYVLFTPRTTDESACDQFRAQLEQMRRASPNGEKRP